MKIIISKKGANSFKKVSTPGRIRVLFVSGNVWTNVSSKSNTKEYMYFVLSNGGKKGAFAGELNELKTCLYIIEFIISNLILFIFVLMYHKSMLLWLFW